MSTLDELQLLMGKHDKFKLVMLDIFVQVELLA
jgi:hypothetical protein